MLRLIVLLTTRLWRHRIAMLAQLALRRTTQSDVEVAWATYRALILAEADDPALQSDDAHQKAIRVAMDRFARVYDDWNGQ
jgi:hypothetical protein